MPKYFKADQTLLDIGFHQPCRVTLPNCPEGVSLCARGSGFIEETINVIRTLTPFCPYGSRYALTDYLHDPANLINPQAIASLKVVLSQEIKRLEKIEKILEADMTPSSLEEVSAIEKHLDIAQGQLEEARKDLAQKKANLSGKKTK